MPHAGQQNVKESVVWGGGRSQLPGTTKEALGRRHTEVMRHDTTSSQQASHDAQDRVKKKKKKKIIHSAWHRARDGQQWHQLN